MENRRGHHDTKNRQTEERTQQLQTHKLAVIHEQSNRKVDIPKNEEIRRRKQHNPNSPIWIQNRTCYNTPASKINGRHKRKKLNISTPSGGAFLDIEKAFDKVWHEALLYKMKKTRFPKKLTNITRSYLQHRKFIVRIENARSEEKKIQAGVLQGSILGPLLFNIFISDIPKMKHSKIAQFADDTAIYTSNRNKKTLTRRLQEDIDELVEYFKKWRIKVNAKKTVAVYFDYKARKKDTEKPEEITIENQKVKWQDEAKYLGVLIDKNLKFNSQIEENTRKAKQLHGYLYPLLNKKSKLTLENKMKIIKTIIIPSITYAGEIWHTTTQTHRKRTLQETLNKIVRTATGGPWYISNQQIREEVGIQTLQELITRKTEKFLTNIEEHQNEEINKIIQTKTRKTDKITSLLKWKRTHEDTKTIDDSNKRRRIT
ncbi:hypothetical protein HHI36_011468 [Cryptolaemus montrouzieri]|uniref:Reverse transcriptase domain-containing protein n=1 Tax=Cryptolaemus montrouzieri TaxID=559131 RepID=A0ABD2MLS7_9CUCU